MGRAVRVELVRDGRQGVRVRLARSGAAGFLASHLSEALVAKGWEVVGLDNLLTGRMFGDKHHHQINPNRELLALGATNLVAGVEQIGLSVTRVVGVVSDASWIGAAARGAGAGAGRLSAAAT